MIFGKKNNFSDEDTLRNETYERYRQSSPGLKNGNPEVIESVGTVKIKGANSEQAPQWPTAKSEINNSPEQEIDLLLSDSADLLNEEPLYKPLASSTASSKLAQFVSTGLSSVGIKQGKTPAPETIKSQVEAPKVNDSFKAAINTAFANSHLNIKLTPEDEIKKKYGSNLKSALGPGTIIEGTFSFDTPVCIEGTLLGEIRSNSLLIVGPEASVQAKIKVGSLVVYGSVRGDVEAQELVDIKENGILEGNVLAERLAIEEGGWFQGRCVPSAPAKVLEQYGRKKETQEVAKKEVLNKEPIQQELSIQTEQVVSNEQAENLLLPEDQIELSSVEKWSL